MSEEKVFSEDAARARLWTTMRALLGFVEDGSHTVVTIAQDNATREWYVRVGKKSYHATSLGLAIHAAAHALGVPT